IVRPEAQARYRVELRVACGEKDDRQLRRQRPQQPAELEAAFGLVLERDVDHGKIRQACGKRLHGLCAVAVCAHDIALAGEGRSIIVADSGLVLDDGDEALHARDYRVNRPDHSRPWPSVPLRWYLAPPYENTRDPDRRDHPPARKPGQ